MLRKEITIYLNPQLGKDNSMYIFINLRSFNYQLVFSMMIYREFVLILLRIYL